MNSPRTLRTFTVEGTSERAQAAEGEIDHIADHMVMQGVESPAVLLLDEGRLGCTAQVLAANETTALSAFTAATPNVRWWQLHTYEGEPA